MLTLLIESYLNVLLSIAALCVTIFIAGLYLIFRKPRSATQQMKTVSTEANTIDFSAIAGDDVMTTQLDLARAFIESGRKEAAKSILQTIVAQGSQTQQAQEAKTLLGSI